MNENHKSHDLWDAWSLDGDDPPPPTKVCGKHGENGDFSDINCHECESYLQEAIALRDIWYEKQCAKGRVFESI